MAYSYRTFSFGGMLTPVVKRLIIANVAVYLLTLVVGQHFMDSWFAFQRSTVFLRPWSVFTYMFVHGGFWHVGMNMLFLFFFGPPVEAAWGGREFFKYYVICGLGGVAFSLFMPDPIIGASAAIYGVMLAFAMSWPDAPIYFWGIFPIKAKWLVGFFFLISLFYSIAAPNGGGVAHLAHVGGFLTGFLYLKSDWRGGHSFERLKKAVRTHPRLAIVPHRGKHQKRQSASKNETQEPRERKEDVALYDAVDQVLDKISEQGMSSLTAAERKLLDDVSRKHRTN